jgi:hypothetical protein
MLPAVGAVVIINMNMSLIMNTLIAGIIPKSLKKSLKKILKSLGRAGKILILMRLGKIASRWIWEITKDKGAAKVAP